ARDRRPGGARLRAEGRRPVLPQVRVLLLREADARAARDAPDARGVRRRSAVAGRRAHDHAFVYLLRNQQRGDGRAQGLTGWNRTAAKGETGMAGAVQHHEPEHYFVPQPASYPIRGAPALLLLATGAVLWMNHVGPGPWVTLAGFLVLLWMLFGWFGKVISESESRVYNKQVDTGFRWSMSWFIFSEVMFFAAFFGALFYIRAL